MKSLLWALVIAAGCGKVNDQPKDAEQVKDTTAPDVPAAACVPTSGTKVHITKRVATVTGEPVMLATAPPSDARLFLVTQPGTIRVVDGGSLVAKPFIDLSDRVVSGGERGLLGLAFHPQYTTNKQFFVYYTTINANVVQRCERSATDPNLADRATCVTVLSIPDFASNHNGGMIEFGADGFLYIGTGDGGGANDPNRNGQSLQDGSPNARSIALLGKMLRIDVDNPAGGKPYGIPATNPFAGGGGAPEIFMIGLRNPWRWSFDRANGDMWIADVGQDTIEEIDVVKAGEQAGKNLGWSQYEGQNCFNQPCTVTGKSFPQDERLHSDGWTAIIGGQVYRGSCFPDLAGTYFYADNLGRQFATAKLNPNGTLAVSDLTAQPGEQLPDNVASIHADAAGELYVTTTRGDVFRIEASP